MEIEVAVLVEVGVDGHGHVVSYAEDGSKCIGTRAQVRDSAQVLHGEAFLLQGVLLGVGGAVHLQFGELYLDGLSGALRLNEYAGGGDARACGDRLELVLRELGEVDNNLYVRRERTQPRTLIG